MADFNKLKDTIRGAIYPNGRGAISADKHQAALLDMADTMQETDTKLTELSEEINGMEIPFPNAAWVETRFPRVLKKGEVITAIKGADNFVAVPVDGSGNFYIEASATPFVIPNDLVAFYATTDGAGAIVLESALDAKLSTFTEKDKELDSKIKAISEVINGLSIAIPLAAWVETPLPQPLKAGQKILAINGADNVIFKPSDNSGNFYVYATDVPYTLPVDVNALFATTEGGGNIVIESRLDNLTSEIANLKDKDNELSTQFNTIADEVEDLQSGVGTIEIPFNGKEYANYDYSFVKGQTISEMFGTTGIFLIYADDSNTLILKEQLPYVIDREDAVKFSPITAGEGKLIVQGTIYSMIGGYDKAFFTEGYWLIHGVLQEESYLHTCQFPCKKGDVIKGNYKDVRFFAEKRNYIGAASYNAEGVVIDNADVKYAVINVNRGEENIKTLQINGIPIIAYIANAYFNKDSISASYPFASCELPYDVYDELLIPLRMRSNMGGCILGLWINGNRDSEYYLTGFRYRQQAADWGNTDYTQIVIGEKKADGTIVYHQIVNDLTSERINDDIQVFERDAFKLIIDWRLAARGTGEGCSVIDILKLDSITFNKNNTIYLLNYDDVRSGETHLDSNPYIAIPVPQLAIVNIVADYLPTTKTDDIRAKIEFNDMQGNSFAKKVILNKQGTSTLNLEKGNLSIDIMDESYDDSHEIKFGNWVAQDGFHLKSYFWDGIKVKPLAAYDFYESILLSRPCRSNRQWKRMQLPTDIPITGNDINDLYLRIDDGAKCHPSGFPVILYHNGVFFGIYCWQLKKHRKNYHQKKNKAGHIHLDGNISAPLLWEANGNIDWNKWAGKEYESADSDNKEGIEIRNPKKLILVDGSEYDGETNAGELISATSPNYNPNNADMVRTASVRASIEAFSRNATEIINMSKGAARKAKIAEVFDVDGVIDYIIFSQVLGNRDGYKKNWQWFTYDGVKWAVAAYDLDGLWGWDSWYYFEPWNSLYDYKSPIIPPIAEEYAEELRERYKYLRDTGVISVSAIMKPLVHYVQTIGNEYYELEDERWTDGVKDNLWRFETWIEESIKLQDAWLGYTSN